MREFKLRKFRRDKRDYNNDKFYNFSVRPKPKRVTWADEAYSDFDSADGDSTGTSGDEGKKGCQFNSAGASILTTPRCSLLNSSSLYTY